MRMPGAGLPDSSWCKERDAVPALLQSLALFRRRRIGRGWNIFADGRGLPGGSGIGLRFAGAGFGVNDYPELAS